MRDYSAWASLIMGWPAVILSLVCTTGGLLLRRTVLMTVGALIAVPFCFYLALNPYGRIIGPTIAVCYGMGAYALAKGRRCIALLLLLPFILVAGWLAVQVIKFVP